MTRQEWLLMLVKQAAGSVPGGSDAVKALEGLITRDDNPDNDVDEVAGHIATFAISVAKAYESISGKDVVNDEAFAELTERVKEVIKLVPQVKAKAAA